MKLTEVARYRSQLLYPADECPALIVITRMNIDGREVCFYDVKACVEEGRYCSFVVLTAAWSCEMAGDMLHRGA